MSADADHEVIDSPEALFRHLYEEHGVEEARDLDPETAPLQFWLRRHADLERAQRAARRRPEPPTDPDPEPERRPRAEPRPQPPRPQPETRSRPQAPFQPEPRSRPEPRPEPPPSPPGAGRRHAGFGDPLVEAMARAGMRVPVTDRGKLVAYLRAGTVPAYVAGTIPAGGNATTPVPILQGIASTYTITPPRTYGIELQYRFF